MLKSLVPMSCLLLRSRSYSEIQRVSSRQSSYHLHQARDAESELELRLGSVRDNDLKPLMTACSTASTCLASSSTSSVVPDNVDVDDLVDAKQSLRLFAWRFVQSRMSGKYNQVLLVTFLRKSNASHHCVTPQRQSMVVPFHLKEIKSWIRPKKFAKTLEKNVELYEKRLHASLRVSQFDSL